mmetsp:Transcript_25789/g.35592  ORF Transcript_25789/g.35592 Transcript_25789/m.35592 type:complete len:392 (-) Transcript_25789:129-1304(-)
MVICVDCGKPCRSATEQELHTQRTGHCQFVDKTDEVEAVNTESDMKKLKEEMMDIDGEEDVKVTEDKEEEKIPAEVNQTLLKELTEMGFGVNRATRAIHFTGTSDMAQAVDWIMGHEEDADLDEPLMVSKTTAGGGESSSGPKLSKEEAKAKAEELVRKAKQKREAEERAAEKLREQDRIRSGKEMQEIRRIEQEQERERLRVWRKKEKEEEARAKARIKEKLEEDRKHRRRKLGLPEDPTEEELLAKAEKEKKAGEQAKPKAEPVVGRPAIKPVTAHTDLRALLVKMKQTHKDENERVTKAFNTLLTYLGNIVRSPTEEKFRKINLGNAAFQTRLGSLEGGVDFLIRCGFQKDPSGETLFLPPDKIDMEVLNVGGGEINSALTNPFFGVL